MPRWTERPGNQAGLGLQTAHGAAAIPRRCQRSQGITASARRPTRASHHRRPQAPREGVSPHVVAQAACRHTQAFKGPDPSGKLAVVPMSNCGKFYESQDCRSGEGKPMM